MVSTGAINTDAPTLGHVNAASGGKAARRNLGAKRVAHVVPKQVYQLLADAMGQRALDGLRSLAEVTVEHLLDGAHRFALGLGGKPKGSTREAI
jgi:hypothetical protein